MPNFSRTCNAYSKLKLIVFSVHDSILQATKFHVLLHWPCTYYGDHIYIASFCYLWVCVSTDLHPLSVRIHFNWHRFGPFRVQCYWRNGKLCFLDIVSSKFSEGTLMLSENVPLLLSSNEHFRSCLLTNVD